MGVRWLDGKQTLNAAFRESVDASPVKKIIAWISADVKPAGYSSLTKTITRKGSR